MSQAADRGACIVDHYDRWFRKPIAYRNLCDFDPELPSLQVLAYEGAFEGCTTFATAGVSRYPLEELVEVTLTLEGAAEEAGIAFALLMWRFLAGMERSTDDLFALRPGMVIRGVEVVARRFAETTGYDALYVMSAWPFPPGFRTAPCPGRSVSFLAGFFVTAEERQLFERRGPDALEQWLEECGADPFSLSPRPTPPRA